MEELLEVKLICFSCPYAHSCKYYQNSLWNTYMFSHPEDGCPTKYPFDSIYYETQKYLKKKNEEAKRNGTFFRR